MFTSFLRLGCLATSACFATFLQAADPASWSVPLGGNAYLTASKPKPADSLARNGNLRWSEAESVFSVYFRVDRACELDLALRGQVPGGTSQVEAAVGTWKAKVSLTGAEVKNHPLGHIAVKEPGYVRVDLRGLEKSGSAFADVSDLVVASGTAGVKLNCVKNNDGNMFYWGRRGPSVHLNYELPARKTITHAYSELNVPAGQDPIGSYFMANGFGEGYFGIQVKSETERWILFSVWSPFSTNNPSEIPESDRIQLLAKGEGVKGGSFGGEGSGGQSYLVYPWKAGVTYRFLNSAIPDGKGNTVYSAWFGEVGKEGWKLIARFQRPKTNKSLTGFHSFLENFANNQGFLERRAFYGNQWVLDTTGQWHEITKVHFTGDNTAGGGHRLDYAGGAAGKAFFMRNGGFFSDNVGLNQNFTRESSAERKPMVDVSKLP